MRLGPKYSLSFVFSA